MPFITRTLLIYILTSEIAQGAFYYPSAQVSLLEHILVDNWGAYASNFSSAITPCTNYVSQTGPTGANSGRTTAAQWMRVGFHDFVTANVSAGTGGIDASIGFETLREENKGSAMNDSFAFWRPFVNDEVSMADLVALGTVMTMNLCGSPKVPYRPGRVDALSAGTTTGVPEPGSGLEETLELFERAGFNKADAIGLTACGHVMGSVHAGGFPDVVPESAKTDNNTNGGINFDTTRGVFDTRVVHEYIDWTGNQGGPLVTSFNETARSDLRLYESDGNATMQKFYDQGEGFLDTCVNLMGRMISTVPSGIQLQDAVQAMPVKPVNVTWDFGQDRKLKLSGVVRVLTPAGESAPAQLTFEAGDYSTQLSVEAESGSSVFGGSITISPPTYGTTTYFPFSVPGSAIGAGASFTISSTGIQTQDFVIQNNVFVIPSMTSVVGTSLNTTIAVRPSDTTQSEVVMNIAAPVDQIGTLGPKIVEIPLKLSQLDGLVDGYELWEGSVDIGQQITGLVSIKLFSDGKMLDVLMLNPGTAGW